MAQRLDESAPAQTTAREQIRQFAPRLIVLALMCVLVQGLMGLSYMGAFGKPEAKKAPFIVVSHTEGNAGYIANKLNAIDGQPVLATISTDEKAAIEQVKKDKAVGVYVFNPSKTEKNPKDTLYYASAQGASRAQVAQTVATKTSQNAKRGLVTHDVVKAAPDDARGTAAFYLVLAWMVGAYLLPASMTTVVGNRSHTAIGARMRLLLFAGYAVLSGIVGTLVAQHMLDALPGPFWKMSAMGMALVFAVSTFTFGLTSAFGSLGVGLAILLFVILGNPSAGGAFAYDVLPEPWRSVGPYLPNGAGVDAVRSTAYFGGVDLTRPLWVVAVWGVIGLWILFMIGNNTYRFAPGGVDASDDDGVGAVGEFVEHQLGHHPPHRQEGGRGPGYERESRERASEAASNDDVDGRGDGGDRTAELPLRRDRRERHDTADHPGDGDAPA